MGTFMVQTANTIWRDYNTDGVPSSEEYDPKKADIRAWGTWVESIITAFTSGGGLIYTSKASLDADLAHDAHSMAWVIGDPIAANNGVYMKLGASGAGSWTRVADLPFSFIIASDAGAGTPNAIQATTSLPVSPSALVWMNIFEANTASPVTVSFNGGSALTIKTNSGNDVAAGGLVAGVIVMGIVSGSTFRLVSDQASAAIVAAAEAAQAAAEAAQAAAEAAAAGVNLPPVTDGTMLVDEAGARISLPFAGVRDRLDPLRLFYADGTTDDSANFAALEATVTGQTIDGRGKRYLIAIGDIPSKNIYVNGFWSITNFEGDLTVDIPFDFATLPVSRNVLYAAPGQTSWAEDSGWIDDGVRGVTYSTVRHQTGNRFVGVTQRGTDQHWQRATPDFGRDQNDAPNGFYPNGETSIRGVEIKMVRRQAAGVSYPTDHRLYARNRARWIEATDVITPRDTLTSFRILKADLPNIEILEGTTVTIIAANTVGGQTINGTYTCLANNSLFMEFSPNSSTVTITIATPAVISWAVHGLAAGTPISFTTTGALPTGLAVGTTYYVVNPTTDAFSVSATPGGSAINTSGTQSGVHTARAIGGSFAGTTKGGGFTQIKIPQTHWVERTFAAGASLGEQLVINGGDDGLLTFQPAVCLSLAPIPSDLSGAVYLSAGGGFGLYAVKVTGLCAGNNECSLAFVKKQASWSGYGEPCFRVSPTDENTVYVGLRRDDGQPPALAVTTDAFATSPTPLPMSTTGGWSMDNNIVPIPYVGDDGTEYIFVGVAGNRGGNNPVRGWSSVPVYLLRTTRAALVGGSGAVIAKKIGEEQHYDMWNDVGPSGRSSVGVGTAIALPGSRLEVIIGGATPMDHWDRPQGIVVSYMVDISRWVGGARPSVDQTVELFDKGYAEWTGLSADITAGNIFAPVNYGVETTTDALTTGGVFTPDRTGWYRCSASMMLNGNGLEQSAHLWDEDTGAAPAYPAFSGDLNNAFMLFRATLPTGTNLSVSGSVTVYLRAGQRISVRLGANTTAKVTTAQNMLRWELIG